VLAAGLADAEGLGCQVFWAAADELGGRFPLRVLLDCLQVRPGSSDPARREILDLLHAADGASVDPLPVVTYRLLALVDRLCAAAPVVVGGCHPRRGPASVEVTGGNREPGQVRQPQPALVQNLLVIGAHRVGQDGQRLPRVAAAFGPHRAGHHQVLGMVRCHAGPDRLVGDRGEVGLSGGLLVAVRGDQRPRPVHRQLPSRRNRVTARGEGLQFGDRLVHRPTL
jgi:hypothetical protein